MLDAAVAAFARHGYSAASMDGIAQAAGVSKPLVRETEAPSAKETAATLMNFCWGGLESLLGGARWTPAR